MSEEYDIQIHITYSGEYSDLPRMFDNEQVKIAAYKLADAIVRAKPIGAPFCRVVIKDYTNNRVLAETFHA